jgi:hypothetical protein
MPEMHSIQWGFKPRLNQVKPPADVTDFEGSQLRLSKCLNFCKKRRNTANRTHCCSIRNSKS